jgi:hypothetical protein
MTAKSRNETGKSCKERLRARGCSFFARLSAPRDLTLLLTGLWFPFTAVLRHC